MDRYIPPFLGRRRGWVLITQVLLLLSIAAMALHDPARGLQNARDQRDRDHFLQRIAGYLARCVPDRCAAGSRNGGGRGGVRAGLSHRDDLDWSAGIFPRRSNSVAGGVRRSVAAVAGRYCHDFHRARAGAERRAAKDTRRSGRASVCGFLPARRAARTAGASFHRRVQVFRQPGRQHDDTVPAAGWLFTERSGCCLPRRGSPRDDCRRCSRRRGDRSAGDQQAPSGFSWCSRA